MKPALAAALALFLPLSALAEGGGVTVTEAWARANVLASRPGAAYLTLQSVAGDRLTSVTTPVAQQVMIHAVETSGGVNRMTHLPALDLPPGQNVALTPGGTHLMLMGLVGKLEEGSHFPLTLRFETADPITIEVPVLGIAAAGLGEVGQ